MTQDEETKLITGAMVARIFANCVNAIRNRQFITRESNQDKEFHFQNWFGARLTENAINHEIGGRNQYPDFRLVHVAEGYEVKGLAYPGRETTYDSNSQVPTGMHNGRTIFYVFGRYPAVPDGVRYPVLDFVLCHGDFLNADHDYVHRNKSIKGFGSYGDILIRDRKMYVAPTPFGLLTGVAHLQTLIVPENFPMDSDFQQVGAITRKETERLIVGYDFNLRDNRLTAETIVNPSAGKEHRFLAWRLRDDSAESVALRETTPVAEGEIISAMDDEA